MSANSGHSAPECVFCRIVAGTLPCNLVAEFPESICFLDVHPLSKGHCLLVPKSHHATLDDMTCNAGPGLSGDCAFLQRLPLLCRAIVAATGAKGYNIVQNNGSCAGQEVHHVHVHIVPRWSGDGLRVLQGPPAPGGRQGAGGVASTHGNAQQLAAAMKAMVDAELATCTT